MIALPQAIGFTKAAEKEVEAACERLAKRHSDEFEIQQGCKLFGQWSKTHGAPLEEAATRYGIARNSDPGILAGALFRGSRQGGFGLIRDLQDFLILIHQAQNGWTMLSQAAKEGQDSRLVEASAKVESEFDLMIAWVCSHIKLAAPQALTVPGKVIDEVVEAMPRALSEAVLPSVKASLLTALIAFGAGFLIRRRLAREWKN